MGGVQLEFLDGRVPRRLGVDFGVDVRQDSGGLCKQDLGRLF
jgi:hypothetical protein